MTSSFTITLRGQTFTAIDPTDTEIFTLASLLLTGNQTRDRLASLQHAQGQNTLYGYDVNDPNQLWQASATLVDRLLEPHTKARIAHALVSLFPDIPQAWVSYRLLQQDGAIEHDFRLKLTTEELIHIIQAASQAIASVQGKTPLEQGAVESVEVQPGDLPGLTVARPPSAEALQAELAAVRSQLQQVSAQNGFTPKRGKKRR